MTFYVFDGMLNPTQSFMHCHHCCSKAACCKTRNSSTSWTGLLRLSLDTVPSPKWPVLCRVGR